HDAVPRRVEVGDPAERGAHERATLEVGPAHEPGEPAGEADGDDERQPAGEPRPPEPPGPGLEEDRGDDDPDLGEGELEGRRPAADLPEDHRVPAGVGVDGADDLLRLARLTHRAAPRRPRRSPRGPRSWRRPR